MPLWIGLGFLILVTVTVLSLIPLPPQPPTGVDKLQHLMAYAAIAGWFACCIHPRLLWVVVGFAVVWGLMLELLQSLTGYRMFDWLDVLANSGGALLGGLLARSPLGNTLQRLDHLLTSGRHEY